MFEPMFGPHPGLFGIPAMAFILAFAAAISAVGIVWVRRLTEIEPESRSFRATASRPRVYRPVLIGLGVAILALLAIGLTVTNSWVLL